MVLAEQRHVHRPDRDGLRLEAVRRLLSGAGHGRRRRAAVRPGRERRVMKERDDVMIARAIEMLELIGHPRELDRVGRDVRVERDEERVAVAERVCRIAAQAARRSLGRDQLRHRRQRVVQPERALRIAGRHARDVVVADGEEIRDVRAPASAAR